MLPQSHMEGFGSIYNITHNRRTFKKGFGRIFSLFLAIINSLKVWIGFLFRNTSPMKHVFVFYQSFTWTNTRLLLETYFIPDIRPKSVFSYAFHPLSIIDCIYININFLHKWIIHLLSLPS